MNRSIFAIWALSLASLLQSQNLPSLLTDSNINSTFAIVAYDEDSQEWGVAVATNNICVGNSTIYIKPGLGAFAVIADTEPAYATQGFEKLAEGRSIEEAIVETSVNDKRSHYRQVAGIDAQGNTFAYTGSALKYWNGKAGTITGTHYVVLGNQLAEEVLSSMSVAFENTEGPLAQQLLQSLLAGQKAGGQISGKQSAAIVVKGTNNEWFNQIDLRVDHSLQPLEELATLMNYYYGRIQLNRSIYALRAGNQERAAEQLKTAETMLVGWTGIYPRIAKVHIAMGNEDAAVDWIKKGLAESRNWSVYLPAFYCLKDHPELQSIILPDSFSVQDWENAIDMLSTLGKELEVIEIAEGLLAKDLQSSYLHYLLGRSYYYEKEEDKAITHLENALEMDQDNVEAQQLLKKIRKD